MSDAPQVLARFGPDTEVGRVMARIVLALGARTAVGVERLGELGIAIEVAAQEWTGAELVVAASTADGGLDVRISPVSAEGIARRAALLEPLVDRLGVAGSEVQLDIRP